MNSWLDRGTGVLRAFAERLTVRRDTAPIDTIAAMSEFARTRASFVAQHKLYGYLKTRMGMQYPTMFENDTFVVSINIAKEHVFAACLSDLTVHTVARGFAGSGTSADERSAVASAIFRRGIAEATLDQVDDQARHAWLEAFDARLKGVHWENIAAGGDCFTESPRSLVRWAPIAPELKKYDRKIIENSVRYAWNEIIRDFRNRHVAAALEADLRSGEQA